MCKLTKLFYFTICICIVTHSSAQSNIDITHYSKDYGLYYRWVYDITQDDYGFMWFANHTGLRRYDGKDYVHYKHSETDSTTLSSNTVTRVAKDHEGNIWAYGIDGVFNKLNLDSGAITRINSPYYGEPLQDDFKPELMDFGALNNGDFIALYHNNGIHTLWKYVFEKNTFEHLIDISTGISILDYFTERTDGKLWIWGMGMGYYLVEVSNSDVAHYPVATSELHTTLPIDNNGNFWYPSNNSSSSNTKENLKSFKIPEDVDVSKINRINLDDLGNIWFYHGEADLYHFDVKKETLEKFVDPIFDKSEGVQLMHHFFEDQEGGYWNGHFFGAIRFNKQQHLFSTYFNKDHDNGDYVNPFHGREILELSQDSLLVKENEHDLFIIDVATQQTKKLERKTISSSGEQVSKSFYSMVLSRDGYLWTNQADKLIKTNIETGNIETFKIPSSPLAKGFNEDAFEKYWPRIFEDASGNLWWCDPEGLSLFDRATKKMNSVQVKPEPASVSADFKYAHYDSDKDAIYASYNKGVYVVNCKNKTVSLIEIFSVQEGYDLLITAILNWKNEFWLSTNKGLIRYNPKTKEQQIFNSKYGLPSSIVYSTLGSNEHLWLATHNGLCQLDPYKNQIKNYYKEHGLAFNNFNIWSSKKTRDEKLYFGGGNGIIGFNPDDFKMTNEKKGLFNLVEISKYNKNSFTLIKNMPYALTDKIVVSPNERTLVFKYMHALYDTPFKSHYSHYMKGLDNDWIQDGDQNEIRYVNIPPGNYTFLAKAMGANNISALNDIAIPIVVEQYWYLRWWSILGYLLLIGFFISMIYNKQLKRKLDLEDAIRIKELDEVKTKMYTNITHEFRTPLTVILGMNDAVIDYSNAGEVDKIYHANDMIDRNGKNLLNLVNQMLELSKLEAGLLKITNQQGNIVDYLKYRMESFQSYSEVKNIQIYFHRYEDPIMMDFDVDKISYIIGNLVSNAIKFTPKNGSIHVQVSKILNPNNEPYLELKVKDTGIGIQADKIDRIFDRFYQIDDSNIRKGEGSGIGLSLVKELVKLLKGNIQVNSVVNEGTEFTVLLPITANAEIAKTKDTQSTSHEWSESIYNLVEDEKINLNENQNDPLILIVEDHEDVSHYIRVSIQDNYRTVRVNNGIKGIEKAIELVPDIIISDVMMPGKDGFELCETIKKDERTSHIPVILLTGKADVDSKIQGLEHGADVYLSKPFNRKELLIRLKNLLVLRAEIQKHYSETDFKQPISGLSNIENAFLLKIRTRILEHIADENFGITQLCGLIHLSRAQLHRKLIALTGESTSNLIRKVQLEKAKELLSSGELNVSEVAYMVGFKTQAHFSRVFSEAFGKPPSNYIKK
jgi:signal transduction histidine kinase/DNA-binding response OmpR family regulator/streptogramin lyase